MFASLNHAIRNALILGRSVAAKKSIRDSSVYVLGNIVSRVFAVLVLPIFTRYLSPADYGILSYVGSITAFLAVLSVLRLNAFALRHYFEMKTEEQRKSLFGTLFVFMMVVNVLLLFLELRLLPHLLHFWDVKIPFHPYFRIALFTNFIDVANVLPLCYLRVTRNASGYVMLTTGKGILQILLSLVLVVMYRYGVMGRFWGEFYVGLLFLGIDLYIILKISSFKFDFSLLKRGLQFSLPLVPGAIPYVAMMTTDRIILERYVDISQLGIYSIASTLGTILIVLVRAVYYAFEPEIYRRMDSSGFIEDVVQVKTYFLYLLLALGFMNIVFSREVVLIFASEAFASSYKVVPFFVVGTLFRGVQLVVATVLFGLNKTIYQPIIIIAGLVCNIALNLVLIPYTGIYGAAAASCISTWFTLLITVYFTNKFVPFRWNVLRDSLLVFVTGIVAFTVMGFHVGGVWVTTAIKVFMCLILFLLIAVRFFGKESKAEKP